jgi:hypothetical protein
MFPDLAFQHKAANGTAGYAGNADDVDEKPDGKKVMHDKLVWFKCYDKKMVAKDSVIVFPSVCSLMQSFGFAGVPAIEQKLHRFSRAPAFPYRCPGHAVFSRHKEMQFCNRNQQKNQRDHSQHDPAGVCHSPYGQCMELGGAERAGSRGREYCPGGRGHPKPDQERDEKVQGRSHAQPSGKHR